MAKKTKDVRVKISAELLIDRQLVENKDSLIQDLVGEFLKVKSGAYENIACGNIESAEVLS